MEKTERSGIPTRYDVGGPGFVCPRCGGESFGTMGLDKPETDWKAYCTRPGCGWDGPHAEHVFPARLRAESLRQRGFTDTDAEQVERFARRLFFGKACGKTGNGND